MLHDKCIKCRKSEANGVLILSVTKDRKGIKLYCIKCEQEILHEMSEALDVVN